MITRETYLWILAVIASSALLFSGNAWSADSSEPLQPGEQDFERGGSDRGNEDSEIVRNVTFGSISMAGSGCPGDSARATVSPDGKTISILFDRFQSRASGQQRVLSNCELRIPVNAPQGYRMMVSRFDFRGFAQASARGRSVLQTNYQILGSRGDRGGGDFVRRRKVFEGPSEQLFEVAARVRNLGRWTGCNENFTIRLNANLIAVGRAVGSQASIQLDSIDGSQNVKYHLRWQRCR